MALSRRELNIRVMMIRRQLEASGDKYLIELNTVASDIQLLKLARIIRRGAKDERQQFFNERLKRDWNA